MNSFKIFQFSLLLIISLGFTACIKKLDSNGLTLKIEESQLNKSSKKFPIKKDFIFAKIQIEKPHISIKKSTNRLSATVDINLNAIFMPSSKGKFTLSGKPYFNKEKAAIFLQDVKIEELKFTNVKIDKKFTQMIASNMKPVIDNIFTNIPIYELDKKSFKGTFVKNVKIENSELLITFGL